MPRASNGGTYEKETPRPTTLARGQGHRYLAQATGRTDWADTVAADGGVMTKIVFGIGVPYQSRRIKKSEDWASPLEWEPCIRHKDLSFELCDICGSGIPPGRAKRGITTCCPKCNSKKWDAKNGLIIEQERNACGVRPTSFWNTISFECFKRDNFTCQHCKKDREQLERDRMGERNIPGYKPDNYILNCHHIKPIKVGGNNRLENLITLCGKCHKVEHSRVRNIARKHKPLICDG